MPADCMETTTGEWSLAAWEASYQIRRDRLLRALAVRPFRNYPKNDLPICCARIELSKGQDSEALAYLAKAFDLMNEQWGSRGDSFFIWIGMVRGLYMFANYLTADQIAHMRRRATSFRGWFRSGTENHRLMTYSSLYLFAQAWPDAEWFAGEDGDETVSSGGAMEKAIELLTEQGHELYRHGSSEFLSPVYETFHVAPMVSLWEFAREATAKRVAEAFLAYHLCTDVLNSHNGVFVAPTTREYGPQHNRSGLAIGQYLLRLYWGDTDSFLLDDDDSRLASYAGYLALSAYRPHELITRLATDPSLLPTWTRESKCFWMARPDRYVMRSSFRTPRYAIGCGNMRCMPGGYVLDNTQFSIVVDSPRDINTIHCYHNYYYSNFGEVHLGKGLTSPFMQMTHDRNRAIVLFSIPQRDPFPGAGRPEWILNRNAHFDNLLRSAQVRYPLLIDRIEQRAGWTILQERGTYVAIKPLGGETQWFSIEQFAMIANRGPKVGFVFHIETVENFPDLDQFAESLEQNTIQADMEHLQVTYRSPEGELRLVYNHSTEGLDCSVPRSWIDQKEVRYEKWPAFDSDHVHVEGNVLRVEVGEHRYCVDWTGSDPAITGS